MPDIDLGTRQARSQAKVEVRHFTTKRLYAALYLSALAGCSTTNWNQPAITTPPAPAPTQWVREDGSNSEEVRSAFYRDLYACESDAAKNTPVQTAGVAPINIQPPPPPPPAPPAPVIGQFGVDTSFYQRADPYAFSRGVYDAAAVAAVQNQREELLLQAKQGQMYQQLINSCLLARGYVPTGGPK